MQGEGEGVEYRGGDGFVDRLREIESHILEDPTFRTLAMNSTTVTYLGLRAEEIIKNTLITTQVQEIQQLRKELQAKATQVLPIPSHMTLESQLKAMKNQLQETKEELERISESYLQTINKNSEYLQRMSHLRSQVDLLSKIEQKATQQYEVIKEKEQQLIDVNTKIHKEILIRESLKREKQLLETEVEILKETVAGYSQTQEKEKAQLKELNTNKQENSRLRKELSQEKERGTQMELRLIQVESENRKLREEVEVLDDDNRKLSGFVAGRKNQLASPSKFSPIKRQKKLNSNSQFKSPQKKKNDLLDLVSHLKQENDSLRKQKPQSITRILYLQAQVRQLNSDLSQLKHEAETKLAGVIELVATKFLALTQLIDMIQARHSNKVSLLRESHLQQLSSLKCQLTRKLITHKKELRHYIKELGHNQNMFQQVERELKEERQECISNRISSSHYLIKELETKLYFKEEIEGIKKDQQRCKQLSGIKSNVKRRQLGEETRRSGDPQTTKKKTRESEG